MIKLAHTEFFLVLLFMAAATVLSQTANHVTTTPTGIRIGERLSYNISFQRYDNVGYAETYAVSRGKLGEADAVELRMKIKTTGLLSAAFYQIDESRTTFAAFETGMPLLVRRQDNSGVAIRETVSNYLAAPASGLDILTAIYKARQTGGSGTFILNEGDRSYSVTFQPQGAEHIRTDAGEFDTTISTVQSDYLAEAGIQTLKINFSTDEAHVPVLARFKTAKGELRALLSGLQTAEPDSDPTPTPLPTQTPRPTPTPKATPTPYIDNLPLAGELGFSLGEKLTYRLSSGDRVLGEVVTEAGQRKFVSGEDSLILEATVTRAEQGNGVISVGDTISSRVNPETLVPFELTSKMSGPLSFLNQTTRFDQKVGVAVAGTNRVDVPIGTHNILSLLYAARSFNLNPSKDAQNPVNDTRVAVYWQGKAFIFILRPSEPAPITVNGQKMLVQQIAVRSGIAQLDQMGINFWLSTDVHRIPVRMTLGNYQLDLISQPRTPLR
jgi:hypothetical protein